ncbi:hypothetical protein [Candidatus Vidania fulgoroideorum]
MLKIILSKMGRKKSSFFRILSSNYNKKGNSGSVYGFVDRIKKIIKIKIKKIKKLIKNGVVFSKGMKKLLKSINNKNKKYDLQIN